MKGGKKMELRREEQSDSRRFQKSEVHRGLACAVKVIAEGACRDRRGSEFLVPSTRPGSATSPPPPARPPLPCLPKRISLFPFTVPTTTTTTTSQAPIPPHSPDPTLHQLLHHPRPYPNDPDVVIYELCKVGLGGLE